MLRKHFLEASGRVLGELEKYGKVEVLPQGSGGMRIVGAGAEQSRSGVVAQLLPTLGVLVVSGPPAIEGALRSDVVRDHVEANSFVFTVPRVIGQADKRPGSEDGWSLEELLRTAERVGPHSAQGVVLGFADTGISPSVIAREFAGRTIEFAEFDRDGNALPSAGPRDSDSEGHGSGVTSLAAGSTTGYARGASIAIARCLDDRLVGSQLQVYGALDWLMSTPNGGTGVHLMNCSFVTADPHTLQPIYQPFFKNIIQAIRGNRIPVVAAIGNAGWGNGAGLHGSPGNYAEVIGVGAIDRGGAVGAWCCHGYVNEEGGIYKPDFIAPGVGITTRDAAGNLVSRTGSSFAAPLVSGLAADLLKPHISAQVIPDLRPLLQGRGRQVTIGAKPHQGKSYRLF